MKSEEHQLLWDVGERMPRSGADSELNSPADPVGRPVGAAIEIRWRELLGMVSRIGYGPSAIRPRRVFARDGVRPVRVEVNGNTVARHRHQFRCISAFGRDSMAPGFQRSEIGQGAERAGFGVIGIRLTNLVIRIESGAELP
jgi:hypothetical protein